MSAGAGMSPGGGGMSQSSGMGGLGGGMGGGMGGLGGNPNPNPFSQQFQAPPQQMQPMQANSPMTGGPMQQAPLTQFQANSMMDMPYQQAPLQQGAPTTPFSQSQAVSQAQAPQIPQQGGGMFGGLMRKVQDGLVQRNGQAQAGPQQAPVGLSGLMQQYRPYRY